MKKVKLSEAEYRQVKACVYALGSMLDGIPWWYTWKMAKAKYQLWLYRRWIRKYEAQ